MHDFNVTTWPHHLEHYNIEVHASNGSVDLFRFTPEQASELLECIEATLDGEECSHAYNHRIEHDGRNMFTVLFSISTTFCKAYATNKSKFINLKIKLKGALNG